MSEKVTIERRVDGTEEGGVQKIKRKRERSGRKRQTEL